ncbi:VENN motif pre-toxin domain-containing protein, partial [Serratia nevei]|nr:VENN motif pre-toxin domain-containing protein [Serratia nevei]
MTSSCSALAMPDSVSQSPPITTSPFSHTQSAPKSCRCWLGILGLAARYIAGQLFPGKTAEQLSESEKQQVSALSQLAAGLAGGLATGDTAGAVTGVQAGKNAV